MMKDSVISSMTSPVLPVEVRKGGGGTTSEARLAVNLADGTPSKTAQGGAGSTTGNLAKTTLKAESPLDQALMQQTPTELAEALLHYEDDELNEVVQSLNDYLQKVQRDLEFAVDQESGRTVITVRDRENQEVIRQIPPEEVIAMRGYLHEEGNDRLDSFGLAEEV